jgi:hypothetical protein
VRPGIALKPNPLPAFIHFCPIYLPPLASHIGWEASKLELYQKFLIRGRPIELQWSIAKITLIISFPSVERKFQASRFFPRPCLEKAALEGAANLPQSHLNGFHL